MARVLHVIYSLGQGGAERTLSNICLRSKKHIHHVVCLTNKSFYSNLLEKNNIKIYELNMNKLQNLFISPLRLYLILKKIKPEIVQTWMYHSDLFGGVIARLAGVKVVLWNVRSSSFKIPLISHSSLLTSRINALISSFLPNKIICCGKYTAQCHVKQGYDSSKIKIIFNGVDTNLFSPNSKKRNLVRMKYKINSHTILFGMIARYTPEKDHKSLLKALSLCNNLDQEWKCILCGKDMDYNNYELVEIINSLNLSQKIHLIGTQINVNEIYNALDLHILSSRSEGSPNCLTEALSSGVPCISTSVGDAQFILKKRDWIVNPNNHYQLAKVIKKFINLSESERAKISESSRKLIKSEFSLSKMIESYDNLYSGFII